MGKTAAFGGFFASLFLKKADPVTWVQIPAGPMSLLQKAREKIRRGFCETP